MLRTAREGSYEQIVTLMFGAEWMYSCWCRRASEHRQRDADLRRWVEMHAEDEFYQQALWLKHELDRCAMALSETKSRRYRRFTARCCSGKLISSRGVRGVAAR